MDNLEIFLLADGGDAAARQATADIFLAALRAYLREKGAIPLERLLGIPSPHQSKLLAKATRNHWICVAFDLCGGEAQSDKLAQLERELRHFESTLWPRWKNLAGPPSGSSKLRTALFHAYVAARDGGTTVATSPRMLRYILASAQKKDTAIARAS